MKATNLLLSPTSKTQPVGIINVDWLAFSVTLLENSKERDAHEWQFHQPAEYRLIELQGTNIYRRRLILYNKHGNKILTLLCEPHSRVIDRTAALVEVANEWLYYGFSWVMDCVYDLHPCTFLCLSRLDVCCDFPFTDQRRKLVMALAANECYVAGKRDGSAFFSYTSEDTGVERIPRCLSWGSKKSNIKWKVYNKSAEIYEITADGSTTCHKPYISDEWARAGWNVHNMWRCEVSISPAAKFQHFGQRLSWKHAINGFAMSDLFVSLYMTRFQCRQNQGHRDKSNDKRVHLLEDFGSVARVEQWKNPNPKGLAVVEYADCLNAAMLQLSKNEVLVNEEMRRVWINTAIDCVRLGKLESYFYDKYKCRPSDIENVYKCEMLLSQSS